MTLGHPLVDAALDDLRLTPLHLKVFRVMWRACDFREFRRTKADVIALRVQCDRANASRALQKLVEFGYLEEGERSVKGVGAYRLASDVPGPVHNQHTSVGRAHARRQVSPGL